MIGPTEFLERFPDFREELPARLQERDPSSAEAHPRRVAEIPPRIKPAVGATRAGADRNLLFGILALQMDFITRDALIAAMNAWVLDKAKSLAQILVDEGETAAVNSALAMIE